MKTLHKGLLGGLLLFLFLPTAAFGNSVDDIQMTPDSYSELPFSADVNFIFHYQTDEAGGVRIFFRPMTNGQLSPNYAASGSVLHPTGSGTGTHHFTITSGDITVDEIRVRMTNADQSKILLEFKIPVVYVYRAAATSVYNIKLSQMTPANLANGKKVEISFDYDNKEKGNIRIFPRPMSGGALTPGYGASGSPAYAPGNGTGSGFFAINSGESRIDAIRFQVLNENQSKLLLEFTIPVEYKVPVSFTSVPNATTLSLSKNGRSVTASWTSVRNADGYILGYAPYPGADYIASFDVGMDTSFTLDVGTGSTAYYFGVVPYNDAGNGPRSNIEFISVP